MLRRSPPMLMCQCLSPSSKLMYRSPGLAVSWSRRTVRVVAISMLLAKEWKAVLTRRRRTCQSYIASFGSRPLFGHLDPRWEVDRLARRPQSDGSCPLSASFYPSTLNSLTAREVSLLEALAGRREWSWRVRFVPINWTAPCHRYHVRHHEGASRAPKIQ